MKIEQPCVAIKLTNLYDIQYLLDSNKNIVFCTATGNDNYEIMSYNIELLQEHITQNKYIMDTYYYYYRKKYTHNCRGMRTKDINLKTNFEDFAPQFVNIDDKETLKQYNLSSIDLNVFKTTKLFEQYKNIENFDNFYKSIPDTNNNNFPYDKQYFAITLLFNFFFNVFIPEFNKLEQKIKTSRDNKKYGSDENEEIQKYYSENSTTIKKYISILTDFRKAFVIKEEKKANSEEEKNTEGNKNQLIGIIVGSVIGGILFFAILIYFVFFRKGNEGGHIGYQPLQNSNSSFGISFLNPWNTNKLATVSSSAKSSRLAETAHELQKAYTNSRNTTRNAR